MNNLAAERIFFASFEVTECNPFPKFCILHKNQEEKTGRLFVNELGMKTFDSHILLLLPYIVVSSQVFFTGEMGFHIFVVILVINSLQVIPQKSLRSFEDTS